MNVLRPAGRGAEQKSLSAGETSGACQRLAAVDRFASEETSEGRESLLRSFPKWGRRLSGNPSAGRPSASAGESDSGWPFQCPRPPDMPEVRLVAELESHIGDIRIWPSSVG